MRQGHAAPKTRVAKLLPGNERGENRLMVNSHVFFQHEAGRFDHALHAGQIQVKRDIVECQK